ncbi:MAG TPA: HD domain-containing protein [Actinobacteria bacterium]|nr:HD domain protein [bacterium BMS3Bbin01]HDH26839.1 HD domain-containing protein [Actinomycetota bacterium]
MTDESSFKAITWAKELELFAQEAFAIPDWWRGSPRKTSEKVIHDPVWGSQTWTDWQVAIIDLPIVQRLRDIRQTSFAYLTYPGALHTRFDHSLGVAAAAKLFLSRMKATDPSIGLHEEGQVVAAALLHDIGHGPFSHLTEECYLYKPDWFLGILNSGEDTEPMFPRAAPHEALGALLLRTEAAKSFFRALRAEYTVPNIDPEIVGDIIAGNGWEDHDHLAAVVNGDIDADKADYIRRDSHFTGLNIALDINRLAHTLRVVSEDGVRQLALHKSGEAVANQFLFAKTTLTSSVYHHPKVRAADTIYRSITERAMEGGSDINGRQIESPVAFLQLTDSDFTFRKFQSADEECTRLVRRLHNRHLPYAALEVSASTLKKGQHESKLWNLRLSKNLWRNEAKVSEGRKISQQLVNETGSVANVSSVWIDFPYMVKLATLPLTDGVTLNATYASFPGETWADQYVKYLYRGNLYGPAEALDALASAFESIASRDYDTVFNSNARQTLSDYRAPAHELDN